jgi:hypothetical protein
MLDLANDPTDADLDYDLGLTDGIDWVQGSGLDHELDHDMADEIVAAKAVQQ